jgi:hypothetical protein
VQGQIYGAEAAAAQNASQACALERRRRQLEADLDAEARAAEETTAAQTAGERGPLSSSCSE